MYFSDPVLSTTQGTLARTIRYRGVGLHSGRSVAMQLHPAAPNSGIRFVRKDVPEAHAVIPASWKNVVDTRLCTVLGNEHGVTIGTVEHLLAAIRGSGIDNLTIELDGDEVPILDGSSAPMIDIIKQTGVVSQRLPRYAIFIERPISVRQGERFALLEPSVVPRMTVEIEFDNPAIGAQSLSVDLVDDLFEQEIAPARTFGFASDLKQLRAQGLALGGSMQNAVLVDGDRVVNEEGLRFADEFVRHKILDCYGDLALAGAPIFGQLYARKPGHILNHALLREMYQQQHAWSLLTYDEIAARSGTGQQRHARPAKAGIAEAPAAVALNG